MIKSSLENNIPDDDTVINAALLELQKIRADLSIADASSKSRLDKIDQNYKDSARNLLHYLALRRRDLRPLQHQLTEMGLSSLGRAESHVMATIDAVLRALHRLANLPSPSSLEKTNGINFTAGEQLLAKHTNALLGPATPGRDVRIMVTMPSEAAKDYNLVQNLLQQGMECMRINCAHDSKVEWLQMIRHLRRAEKLLGKTCKVVMDLPGPKLRTGPLEPGPEVLKVQPERDIYGRTTNPARIWVTSRDVAQSYSEGPDRTLTVPANWLKKLRPNDYVTLVDARASKRELTVAEVTPQGCWLEAKKTIYFVPKTVLEHHASDGKTHQTLVGNLPTAEVPIMLKPDDHLILTRDKHPGHPAKYDINGKISEPAKIGCTLPQVFDYVKTGDPIWFNDGKIGGIVKKVEDTRVLIQITQTRIRGRKLRGDKGINLPNSNLNLNALTTTDLESLPFVAQHADVVELSFVNSARDVEILQEQLAKFGNNQPAIVLKVETKRGFQNLPSMLLTAMRSPCCGVMIARGDLAVECGFERMAEVQEEILWICEAAHVPVIWATQVLESLAQKGLPSRAEITDAAMGHRAECVMLNKGPHVLSTVRALDDILRRMQAHQTKKRSMLRDLRLAREFPTQ